MDRSSDGLWLLAAIGVVVGIASALGLTRFMANLLFGVQARDPMVFVGIPLLLTAVALAAVMWVVYARTRFGFELQVIADSPRSARFAGMRPNPRAAARSRWAETQRPGRGVVASSRPRMRID